MELRHLRYFLAVAQEGHFGRAAERLNIVQSALSVQIKALEDELGGPLFIRTTRKVTLTQAGEVLKREAQHTVDQAEHARRAVKRSLSGGSGIVRVGFAGNAVFSGRLMEDVRAFHAEHSDVEIQLQEMAPLLQGEAILSGRLDVGYTSGHSINNTNDSILQKTCVGEYPVIAAMSSDHMLVPHGHLTPTLLINHPLILYTADDRYKTLEPALERAMGCEPFIAYRVASTLTVLALAASGLGVALVPAPLMQVQIPGLVYRPFVSNELNANLFVLSRNAETTGAVKAFLDITLRAKI
ncbi:LysR family transcriptional regulator [Pseudomonas sp. PAMC 29040]|uniref:LysR substrate-binding domain-containing protein n=1 Tax=Pseudomonas sp. PAMC 29040 TaxID=2498450 RepID=UPI000F9674A8|nr:LysR substrate-binding domain-containing protein [Pseudomonas sp. PAMC 29040]RUT42414.1 LysR family transcriptional regulator [Pseudomonas sp. PAMC 29040]